jgi:hypothetical protein
MSRVLSFIAFCAVLISLPVFAQVENVLGSGGGQEKLRVTGELYLSPDHADINVYLQLSLKGKNVTGAKVYLNDSPLREDSPGKYSGRAVVPEKVKLGTELRISVQPPADNSLTAVKTDPFQKMIVGTYRVDNIVQWIFPAALQKINLKDFPPLARITLRWNYSGAPVRSTIQITEHHVDRPGIVFYAQNNLEQAVLEPQALKFDTSYYFSIDNIDPAGMFAMDGRFCSPDSGVKVIVHNAIYFSTLPRQK